MKNLGYENTKINGGFWGFYNTLDSEEIVKNVYNRFKETGRFDAFNCSWREGEPNKPHFFWDSDVAKWMEGVAYLLSQGKAKEYEAILDEVVDKIAEHQRADGYYNSYFLSVEPSKIFTDRSAHELYTLGHFTEAALAYVKATGKRKFLDCVLKNIDMVYRVFVEEQSASFVTPGHEEIELALLKLYEYTKDEKHLKLARFFIDNRGNNEVEDATNGYAPILQSDMPVRRLSSATGHSVRAGYLYTAMARLSVIDNDKELKDACDRLFDDIVNSKMSITGGVGADHDQEKFSYKYDLPNSDTYNETCAAISLAMFAGAMQETEVNSTYADIVERVCYNGFLSGVSLDGEKFFYTNPLEIDRKKYVRSTYQPICERVKVFGCSCCPPNVVRMLASVQRYFYSLDNDKLYCNQFGNSETDFSVNGKPCRITQTTEYPCDGTVKFDYFGEPITLFVRIPQWCTEYKGETENGYAKFSLRDGESVTVTLPMHPHFIEANPLVQDNAGRYAVQYGPMVYCMEEIDNGENLRDITLLENGEITVVKEDNLIAPVIYIDANRRKNTTALYSIKSDERINFRARLIPYFTFANRTASDMLVWTMVK